MKNYVLGKQYHHTDYIKDFIHEILFENNRYKICRIKNDIYITDIEYQVLIFETVITELTTDFSNSFLELEDYIDEIKLISNVFILVNRKIINKNHKLSEFNKNLLKVRYNKFKPKK